MSRQSPILPATTVSHRISDSRILIVLKNLFLASFNSCTIDLLKRSLLKHHIPQHRLWIPLASFWPRIVISQITRISTSLEQLYIFALVSKANKGVFGGKESLVLTCKFFICLYHTPLDQSEEATESERRMHCVNGEEHTEAKNPLEDYCC